MTMNHLHKAAVGLLTTVLFTVGGVSCSSSDDMREVPSKEDGTITVIAEIARQLHSRAYQEEGYVTDGTYYLSYPKAETNNPYNVAEVNFNVEGTIPGMGFVTVPVDNALKWLDVGGGSTPTFYLDNLKPELAAEGSTLTQIKFKADDNPFKAAIFDDKEGKNDLLWGEKMTNRDVGTLFFDLHHNMSRVKVQVTLNKEKGGYESDLTLEGAKVEITSINQTPLSFNRLDGTLELPTVTNETEEEYKKIYTTLTLVNDPTEEDEGKEGFIEWAEKKDDENNENIKTYVSKDFVLPPQGLLENIYRPRLIITLKDGRKYSGILPHAMEIDDDDPNHKDPSYPASLYFLKEHILTIRTVITEEPPELSFMPVWVVKWVDKGEFNLEAHQAGIYKAEEFYNLINYYNDNNTYQLVRYGFLNTDEENGVEKWIFNFFNTVILTESEIKGTITINNGQTDFSFNFNNFTIYVKNDKGEITAVTETQLYNIVTGKSS